MFFYPIKILFFLKELKTVHIVLLYSPKRRQKIYTFYFGLEKRWVFSPLLFHVI